MRSRSLSVTILAVLTVLGGAAPALATHGTWGGYSQANEPNTIWDSSLYMQQQPNRAATEKVYLNGLIIRSSTTPLVTSFELQADGNMIGPDAYYFTAILGYWRDCNGDSYIGAKNVPASWGNFAVYPRAAYEIDTNVCPLGSAYNPVNAVTGDPDGFIDEFRWIGPCPSPGSGDPIPLACIGGQAVPGASFCVNTNPTNGGAINCNAPTSIRIFTPNTAPVADDRDVIDNGSKVWADWSFPGGPHVYSQGLYSTPTIIGGKPPGTYADSDGTLTWIDDASGRSFSTTLASTWDGKPNLGGCGAPGSEPEFLGGPDGTCGLWPMYQVKRLLNDSDTRVSEDGDPTPLVTVFNEGDADADGNACNDFVDEEVQQGSTRVYVGVDDVSPSANPNALVAGSLAGTLANVDRGTSETSLGATPECDDNKTSANQGVLQLESNELDSEFTHRLPTETLNFSADARYHTLDQFGFDYAPSDGAGALGGPTGMSAIVSQSQSQNPGWFGRYGWTPRPPRHGWGALTNAYATFYADVSQQGLANGGATASALPATQQDRHRYGTPEFCAAITTGASNVNPANDWECSVDVWKAKRTVDIAGDPNFRGRPVLGDAYDLRDADCFDNTLSESLAPGARASIAEGCDSVHS